MAYIVAQKNTFLEFYVEDAAHSALSTRRRSWSCGDIRPASLKLPDHIKDERPMQQEDKQEDKQAAKAKQHANGTCKPCVFFASNAGCTRSTCNYCHLTHTPPSGKRPPKQLRQSYKERVQKVREQVQEPEALHAALQDLASQDRYLRWLIIGEIEAGNVSGLQ
eukprot:Skav200533  [mRNA]  locus=scaffold3153:42784:43995:- [translate_table: standard]